MKSAFEMMRRTSLAARANRAAKTTRDPRLRERLDLPLVAIVVTASSALGLAGLVMALSINSSGRFDPEVIQPLPDQRILSNLRDSEAPFLGVVALSDGQGPVVMLRADGQLSTFDEPTGIVTTRTVTAQDTGLVSDPAGLSAGCGRLEPFGAPCPQSDGLFLLSQAGGLAESTGNRWQTRLRDAPWIGEDGTPVEQDDVIAWAASADGRWIAIFARDQGLAVFDQRDDHFKIVDDNARLIDAAAVGDVHLVAADNTFWLGTAQGLARLNPTSSSLSLEWSADMNMVVKDLDITPAGEIIALVEAVCTGDGQAGCLSIYSLRTVDPRGPIVGEVERISQLSAATTRHAVLQGDRIVVINDAGLFVYDQDQRAWSTLRAGRIDAFWVNAQTKAITATSADQLVQVSRNTRLTERSLEGAPFEQIEVTKAGRILGLARDGTLRDLEAGQVLASRDGEVPAGATFYTGAAVADRVLLSGPDGILVHDVAARRFWWLPANVVDPALLQPGNRILAARGAFWLVSGARGTVATVSIETVGSDVLVTASPAQQFAAPLRSFNADPSGLLLVDSVSRPWQLLPTTSDAAPLSQSAVGADRQGTGPFRTAASYDKGVVFASRDEMWLYDRTDRSWGMPFAPPAPERVADLSVGNGLFLLTESGKVFRTGSDNWQSVLGHGETAEFDTSEMTDAVAEDALLYLGGRGQVQAYDLGSSSFRPTIAGGRGDVRIVDVVRSTPVWLSASQLFYGNALMTTRSVNGAWQAPDGIVALAKGGSGGQFAMHWPQPSGPPACTFLSASPPEGRVLDAVQLPGDRVLVATTAGAAIYVDAERRWLNVSGLPLDADLRLQVTSSHLVASTTQRLWSTELSSIPVPDSCQLETLRLEWDEDETGVSVQFDHGREQAVVLRRDGMLGHWSGGMVRPRLSPQTSGPDTARLLQATRVADTLFFTTPDAIWRYELNSRRWTDSPLTLPRGAGPVQDVDLADLSLDRASVTVWTETGKSYVGVWTPDTPAPLREAVAPGLVRLQTPPAEITDISSQGDMWIIGSDRSVEITRLGRDTPQAVIDLPQGAAITPTPYTMGRNTAFVAGAATAPSQIFVLPRDVTLAEQNGDLASIAFAYAPGSDRDWALSTDGETLWRIDAQGAAWSCVVTAGSAASEACQRALAPPLSINPANVLSAFNVEDDSYAVIAGQLVHFDPTRRVQTVVSGPTPAAAAIGFRWADMTYLWDTPGGALWRVDGTDAVRVAGGVSRITTIGRDLLYDGQDGLTRLRRQSPTDPESLSQSIPLRALSVDWRNGRSVVGLTEEGMVRSETGDDLFQLALPRADRVAYVAPITSDFIWVQNRDGGVYALETETCEIPPHPGVFLPCVRLVAGSSLPSPGLGQLLSVSGASSAQLRFAEGALLFRDGSFSTLAVRGGDGQGLARLADTRSQFVSRIETTAAGRFELAPASITRQRTQLLNGVGGVLANVVGAPLAVPALDMGWLRWNRENGVFSVAKVDTVNGQWLDLPATQFIRNGRMLLDYPGRARSAGLDEAFDWISPHAIWRFERPGGAPRIQSLLDLPAPVGLEAGRILFEGRQGVDRGSVQPSADVGRSSLREGVLEIQSEWRSSIITAEIVDTAGIRQNDFAANGFRHDQREAAGWSMTGSVLATPVGLVPSGDYSAVLPLPDGTLPRRVLTLAAETYAETAGQWMRYDRPTARWISLTDPTAQRPLANVRGVIWSMDAGRLSIAAQDVAEDWRIPRNGLAFAADRLLALAATPDTVVLGTGLGTQSVMTAAGLGQAGTAALTQVPALPFDALPSLPGAPVLFAGAPSGSPLVWNAAARVWSVPDANRQPWRERRVVNGSQVQIDLFATAPPIARRAIEHRAGTRRFARFNWQRAGRMPFDKASALYAVGPTVFVATDMGLRVITGLPDQQDRLIDADPLVPTTDAPVSPMTRVGRPATNPTRLIARDQRNNCLEIAPSETFSVCNDPAVIDALYVEEDTLWNWSKTDAALIGRYVLQGNSDIPITTDPRRRWPHDTLAVQAICNGSAVEIWADGRTARETDVTNVLNTAPLASAQCQTAAVPVGSGQVLDAGLYLLPRAGDPALRRVAATRWAAMKPDETLEIAKRAKGHFAYEAGRLRIVSSGAADQIYQYRPMADKWLDMPWLRGLPAMDQTKAVASAGSTVRRLTPLGFVDQIFNRTTLVIDPDTVTFRTTADPSDLATCRRDSITHLDGRAHTFPETKRPASQDAPIVLRCQDGRVFMEDTANRADLGAFLLDSADPFAIRTAINVPDGWVWMLKNDTAGQPAFSEITFRGDTVSLGAGRFDLDDYRSIAAPFDGALHLVTGTGLWRHPQGNLGLNEAERAADIPAPLSITQVSADRRQDTGVAVLCVRRDAGQPVTYTRTAEPEQVEACFDWRGNDNLFQYRHQAQTGPLAIGAAANGPRVARRLSLGLFEDRVAIGLPQPVGLAGDLLVPTAIGAVLLRRDGQIDSLYSHADIVGVATLPGAGPAILRRSGVTTLNGEAARCSGLAAALAQIPADYRVQTVVTRTDDFIHLRGAASTGQFLQTIRCGEGIQPFNDQIAVEDRHRHVAQMRPMPESTSILALSTEDGAVVLTDGRRREFALPMISGLPLGVIGARHSRAIVIVTETEAYLIDTDAAISALALSDLNAEVTPPQSLQPLPVPAINSDPASPEPEVPDNPSPEIPTRTDSAAPVQQPDIALPETMPDPSVTAVPDLTVDGQSIPSDPPTPNDSGTSDRLLIDLSTADQDLIKKVQTALRGLSLYSGRIDGFTGPLTEAAIRSFQRQSGDPATGVLTTPQYNELLRPK